MNTYQYNFQFVVRAAWRHFFSFCHFLVMMQIVRKIRDEKGVFVVVLTNMSKAFDCIPHQLVIAKLSTYGFDMKSLALISAYLKKRKQK